MIRRACIFAAVLLLAQNCFAATAGNTSDPKTPYGPGITNMEATGLGPFKVGFDADCIIDRNLEGQAGVTKAEFEGEWYLLRIGYTIAERFEPYVKFGGSHLLASWDQHGDDIKTRGENALAGGAGAKVLLFEIPEHKIRFSINGQYLYTDPNTSETFVRDPQRTVSATEFQISEWQVAGILSMEFPLNYNRKDPAAIYSLIPYVGFSYADSLVKSKFTYNGKEYSLGNGETKNKFTLITGCDFTSPQNIALSAEGRFIGETAVSGGTTLKF